MRSPCKVGLARRRPIVALLLSLLLASAAHAQVPLDRPGDARPPLPDFAPAPVERGSILPPIPFSQGDDTEALSAGARVFVRAYRITGGSVFTPEELDALTADYTNREVSYGELEALRDRITLAYVARGYVTSGAVVPDQKISDGVAEIQLVEGVLGAVEVKPDGRYRPRVLQSRLIEPGALVDVNEIERRLQRLRQDERIRAVQAQLIPTQRLGEARLEVDVYEERPYAVSAEFSNHESPAIGPLRGRFTGAYLNLLGSGDTIRASFDATEGLLEFAGSYDTPVWRYGTTLELHGIYSTADVVEKPFEDLGIKSRSWTGGATVRQPLIETLRTELGVFLTGELRYSKSFLLGSGFSFSPGPEEGVSGISVLRMGADWSHRTRQQVVVLRTQLSFGIDALGATTNGGSTPDGRFVSWLGQAQAARRFPFLDTLVILRGDVQVASDALLGLEQFAVGGHSTVRGYRENALVRDNGLLLSIEARVPIWKRADGEVRIEGGPFLDYGHSWNTDRATNGPKDLLGIGLALRAQVTRYVKLEAAWAEDVQELPNPAENDLQDHGFQFRMEVAFP